MADSVQSNRENNRIVASAFREAADLLEQQDASQFRILAYLKAADSIESLNQDIADVALKGAEALEDLPGIGPNLAAAIQELVTAGRWSQLERMRGEIEPEAAFQTIPGIGPKFARRLHDHLHVDTLEALEVAAHDGRLTSVPGVGQRRAALIRSALGARLARRRLVNPNQRQSVLPPVELLLDVDREYRQKAAAGKLRTIAPRRFNPEAKAWLPVLHMERDSWLFTVLFSNTARAHELKKTSDWVVIFYTTDRLAEGQCTIVTETTGPMKGRRVVRGRERECSALFAVSDHGLHY